MALSTNDVLSELKYDERKKTRSSTWENGRHLENKREKFKFDSN